MEDQSDRSRDRRIIQDKPEVRAGSKESGNTSNGTTTAASLNSPFGTSISDRLVRLYVRVLMCVPMSKCLHICSARKDSTHA
ncbi:unnamed protein product, partial [Staurois parvus]